MRIHHLLKNNSQLIKFKYLAYYAAPVETMNTV